MTRAQLKPYWRAVGRAASALGLVGHDAVEEYRHKVMMEEVGAEHARDVDPADGFDRVMYRLAVDAGDWSAAARFATGEERRMAHLVEQCARQVIELKAAEVKGAEFLDGRDPREASAAYVVGCIRQAGFLVSQTPVGDWWADISANQAFQVFRMLDTHRRRLLRRLGYDGTLSFDAEASWTIDNYNGGVTVEMATEDTPDYIHVGRIPA